MFWHNFKTQIAFNQYCMCHTSTGCIFFPRNHQDSLNSTFYICHASKFICHRSLCCIKKAHYFSLLFISGLTFQNIQNETVDTHLFAADARSNIKGLTIFVLFYNADNKFSGARYCTLFCFIRCHDQYFRIMVTKY